MALVAPNEDVFGLPVKEKPTQEETNWSHIIELAWSHISQNQEGSNEDLLPVSRFLDLVDILEEILSLPRGSILAPSSRETAMQFMERDTHLQISRQDFETLLNNLSGDQMKYSIPNVKKVSEAYTQIMAEPDVSTLFTNKPQAEPFTDNNNNDLTDINEYEFQPIDPANPLHTSTPLHPKYPNSNTLNQGRQFKRPVKRFDKDRRAISLGTYPNGNVIDGDENKMPEEDNKDKDHPWKVQVSPQRKSRRSHKDEWLIKSQEEQLQYLEHNASLLDDQRTQLHTKLAAAEKQLKEFQENDSRRLQHIEEIEHELETTQNELHERRLKQAEELRKAKEAGIALEGRFGKNRGLVPARPEEEDEEDRPLSPQALGPPLMSSTPAPKQVEEWSDISIRLEKLEKEKKTYQTMLDSMENERAEYLNVISDLKKELGSLQHEIVSLKTSSDEHRQQLQQVAEDQSFQGDSAASILMDTTPEGIFQTILPMIAEQRTYIRELLEGASPPDNKSSTALRSQQRVALSNRGLTIAVSSIGFCLLAAIVSGLLAGGGSPATDSLWWQQLGPTIESWGATLDGWVRPTNQHIPS